AMAALGLPGLGNFIGEFLVLQGVFSVNLLLASMTALAVILAPVYALNMIQKVFYGPLSQDYILPDFNHRELISFGILVLATVWLGLSPQTLLNISSLAVKQQLQNFVTMVQP